MRQQAAHFKTLTWLAVLYNWSIYCFFLGQKLQNDSKPPQRNEKCALLILRVVVLTAQDPALTSLLKIYELSM
jgi:hypothetical protein